MTVSSRAGVSGGADTLYVCEGVSLREILL